MKTKYYDLSIGFKRKGNPNTFFLPEPSFETVKMGTFIGDVSQGGPCNVENWRISPHGNGTHTECVGHISKERIYVSDVQIPIIMSCAVLSVNLKKNALDKKELESKLSKIDTPIEALAIRTIPNHENKLSAQYSGSEPPYVGFDAAQIISNSQINHLLTDLPSLDSESSTELPAHHIFFEYPQTINLNKSVTEMIFIHDEIEDGIYELNLQYLKVESDASPSRPIIF